MGDLDDFHFSFIRARREATRDPYNDAPPENMRAKCSALRAIT